MSDPKNPKGWQPGSEGSAFTDEKVRRPAVFRGLHGGLPWTGPARPTAVEIGDWDIPRFEQPALCAESDPELFHPERGQDAQAAKRICNGDPGDDRDPCPAAAECLEWALDHRIRDGVWGGQTAGERGALLKARGMAVGEEEVERAQILRMIRQGWSVDAVAQAMHVSVRRVNGVRRQPRGAA